MPNQDVKLGDYVLFTDELIEYAKANFDGWDFKVFLEAEGKAWKVIDIDFEELDKTKPVIQCIHNGQEFVFYHDEIKFLKIIERKAS